MKQFWQIFADQKIPMIINANGESIYSMELQVPCSCKTSLLQEFLSYFANKLLSIGTGLRIPEI